jgi:hypothetical protein
MKQLLGLFHAGEQKNLYSTSGQANFITKYFFKKSTTRRLLFPFGQVNRRTSTQPQVKLSLLRGISLKYRPDISIGMPVLKEH